MSGGDWKELFLAACEGDLDLVEYHVRAGVDVNYAHPEFLGTPLVACILARREAVALYLLAHGALPDLHSEFDGLTPLQAARQVGLRAVERQLLLALGAGVPPTEVPRPARRPRTIDRMSYYTQLQLTWDDSLAADAALTPDRVVELARTVVAAQGWSEDLLDDLRIACGSPGLGPPAFQGLQAGGVILLIREISRAAPEHTFFARGCGETHPDLWLRTFRGGEVLVERGPYDELEEPLPEELLAAAQAAAAAAGAAPAKPARRGWLSRLRGDG